MNRLVISAVVVFIGTIAAFAQGSVKGKVLDKQTDEVMEFVNVVVETPAGKLVKGAITDVSGQFLGIHLGEGAFIKLAHAQIDLPSGDQRHHEAAGQHQHAVGQVDDVG